MESIGNDETGVIEIERRGYLTVGEKATVQNTVSDDTTMPEFYALGAKIADKLGLEAEEVIQNLFNKKDAEYIEWSDEISVLFGKLMNYQQTLKLVQATVLLQSRCNKKWSAENTMDLHPDLLDLIGIFYEEEESKSVEAFEKEKMEQGEGQTVKE